MKIHHIGYLVKQIDRSIAEFKMLGFSVEFFCDPAMRTGEYVIDDIRRVKIAFMRNDAYRIELVQPLDQESQVYGLLKKYKNSPYHICCCSQDIEADMELLQQSGWVLFQAPERAPAIHGCQVAFLMGSGSGMLELLDLS